MIQEFCDKVTMLIKENVEDIDEEKAEIINFGLHSLISEITKSIALIIISYFLGVLKLAIIAMTSLGLYRTFAGGFHTESHLKCFSTSVILVLSNIYLAKMVENLPRLVILSIFAVNLLLIWLYAPADVEARPIISKQIRKKFKIKSFICMTILMFLATYIIKIPEISNIIIFSTLLVSIGLTPIAYKLSGCKYSNGKIPD